MAYTREMYEQDRKHPKYNEVCKRGVRKTFTESGTSNAEKAQILRDAYPYLTPEAKKEATYFARELSGSGGSGGGTGIVAILFVLLVIGLSVCVYGVAQGWFQGWTLY
jgi:hypothetical protein